MDFGSQFLIVIAIINLCIGFFIFLGDRRNQIHRSYFFVTLGVALWSFGLGIFRSSHSIDQIWISGYFVHVVAVVMATAFLIFSIFFPTSVMTARSHSVIVILFLVGSLIVFIPRAVIRNALFTTNGPTLIYGPVYSAYGLLIVFLFLWSFYTLGKKWRSGTSIERTQIFYVFFGTFLALVGGIIFDLILPAFDIFSLNWIGPASTLLMIGFMGVAIVRHHILNLRVIASEVFVSFLLLILLGEILIARNSLELVFRLFFFAFVLVISILLVRSVFNEVRQKEELALLTTKLEAANKELERLDQAKSEFLSIASHQLRTPLTAIKGYSSMLLDGTFGQVQGKVREGVDKVFQSTERMVALVNDLLDTSRLESGRMQFTFVETDLGEIVKSVCDEIMPKAQEKKLAIACTIPTAGIPKVSTDQMKIRQVIINFIDNAIKYSDVGPVGVKIEYRKDLTPRPHPNPLLRGEGGVDVERGVDEVVFSVHDNGWGMTPDEMGFLFKKFSRGRGDTSHIKGTGLGLYVCRRLVEAHGGRVWAESEGKGKGSTFFFALKVGWQPDSSSVYQPKDE